MTMPFQTRQKPLDRFPALCTHSVEKIREVLARLYVMPTLTPQEPEKTFEARINNCQLQDIALTYTAYGMAARLDFPDNNYFSQRFPICGKGEIVVGKVRASLSAGSSVPIPSKVGYTEYFDGDYEQLVLRISSEALTRKLAALIGEPICTALRVEPVQDCVRPPARGLRDLFLFLVSTMDSADSTLPTPILTELEQAVMTAFLYENRHNYSRILERKSLDVAPWQVRRAEEYIEANWNRAIGMEDIAAITGASARSIFRAFRQSRGYSPMNFVKQLRLRHARQMLMEPDSMVSVTNVAMACGFGDLGRFSKDYRAAFGELPSEMLSRAKGAALIGH